MPRFLLTRAAAADLEEIHDFVARDRPMAAERLLEAMRAAMQRLAAHPEIGALREDLADEPLRFWPVSSYLIVYRSESSPLEVVRVVHASRDVRALVAGEG